MTLLQKGLFYFLFHKFYIPLEHTSSMKVKKGGKKSSGKNHFAIKLLIILIVALGAIYAGWLFFFSFDSCSDWNCFNEYLKSCDRAKFIGGEDMIFRYSILGSSGDECNINVELLQGELNNQDSLRLEGQSMVCSLPKGFVGVPERDMSVCHGVLRENLQDLVIKKMYTYIIQNIDNLGGSGFEI